MKQLGLTAIVLFGFAVWAHLHADRAANAILIAAALAGVAWLALALFSEPEDPDAWARAIARRTIAQILDPERFER